MYTPPFQAMFVSFVLISVVSINANNPAPCKRPNKEKLKQIKSDFLRKRGVYFTDSFNQLYKADRKSYYDVDSSFISQRSMKIGWISKSCPKSSYYNPCPHYFVLDVDDNRIPKVLLQARCRCSECFQSDGHRPSNPDQTGLGCREINYYSLVMRATGCNEDGEMTYEEVLEPVSVGCACKRQERITMRKNWISNYT